MCGIFGLGLLDNSNVSIVTLRHVLKKLACGSQCRGRDATGYAFTSKNKITIFKHNVSASEFVKMPNYRRVVRNNLSNKNLPYSILGHTRQQTKGAPTNPNNNHPIRFGNIVGVHNGIISNDDELFNELNNDTNGKVKRIGEVDSEIIFGLIDQSSNVNKLLFDVAHDKTINDDPTSKAIVTMASKIVGSFACGAVDAKNPKILWIFRGYSPVTVNYYKEEGLIIFGSTYKIIDEAVETFDFSTPTELVLTIDQGICINLADGKYDIFTLRQNCAL